MHACLLFQPARVLTVLQIGHSKIFKRSWWETMQAQVNQKASNKDIQQLRAQIAQILNLRRHRQIDPVAARYSSR